MHWLDYKINLPLPPARLRWHFLAIIVLGWGAVPNTERDITAHLQCCVFPMIVGLHVAGYWRGASLWRCLGMVAAATVIAFLLRIAVASALRLAAVSIWDSFGSVSDFIVMDWHGRGAFMSLLAAQLVMALLLSLILFYLLPRKSDVTAA